MNRDMFTTPEPEQELLFGLPRDVGTVLMDPPWAEYGGGEIPRGAQRHYPLLKTDEMPAVIRSCPHWDRLADDGHLYMWVTNSFLEDGLWLMNALGYRYVTNLVWTKDRFGLGQYFRGQHELLLFGVRGRVVRTEGTWPTWLGQSALTRGRHSEKPEEVREMIEQASPGLWLEIFAREVRDGWIGWGNELEAA